MIQSERGSCVSMECQTCNSQVDFHIVAINFLPPQSEMELVWSGGGVRVCDHMM